jgi:arylsulfatase A-like enzyme
MNRIPFYILSISFFAILHLSVPSAAQDRPLRQAQDRPNVVIILADDLGIGDVSSYNENAAWKTPNVDRLAANGLSFTDAHTSAAICTPTRYGILTGRYNWRSTRKSGGGDGYSPPLIKNERMTIAELFRDNGYHTALIGKWHLGWDWQYKGRSEIQYDDKTRREIDFGKAIRNGPEDHGFVHSFGTAASLSSPPFVWIENSRATSIPTKISVNYDEKAFWRKGPKADDFNHVDAITTITDRSVEYIEKQAGGEQPFFLYVALTAPHAPIIPTTEFIGKSNSSAYGDFVLLVDHVVGQIVDAIRGDDRLENTLLFFTSDNGQSPRADFDDDELPLAGHNGSYIYRGKKFDIFEGGHRVPFIATWPGRIKKGSRSDETISTVDFMATCAEILDVSLGDNTAEDSYSILPLLEGKRVSKPIREATVMHSSNGRFAIRKGEWKLVLWPGSGGWAYPSTEEDMKGLPRFQLYNLNKDPSETTNLVSKYPKKVSELKTLLSKYVTEGRSTPGAPQKNDGPERWPELEWMDN